MTADLCLRFIINGNPFYYGRLLAAYLPLFEFDDVTFPGAISWSQEYCGDMSEKLHVKIDPASSAVMEMRLPFYWIYDAVSVPKCEYKKLGQMVIGQMAPLKHINGSTDAITLSVFAWSDNVKLAAPTMVDPVDIVPQSEEMGVVSGPSTAIANAAGKLAYMPMVGGVAKRVQKVASGVSSIASAFGLTREVVSKHDKVEVQYTGDISTSDLPEDCAKLSLDSKRNLNVHKNPSLLGLDLGDELDLCCIASKPAFISQFVWSTTRSTDQLLWNAFVQPNIKPVDTENNLHMPPCTFASLPFDYWRGTMRYTFEFVASAMHRGRVKIVFDPQYSFSTPDTLTQLTRIIDIADEKVVTIDVPYVSDRHFLPNIGSTGTRGNVMATTRLATAQPYAASSNGTISLFVLNNLTSPGPVGVDNGIYVNIYVSMTEDAQFALPNNIHSTIVVSGALTPHSEEINDISDIDPTNPNPESLMECTMPSDDTYMVHFGEKIASLAALVKRYNYVGSYAAPATFVADALWTLVLSSFPLYRGLPSASFVTNSTTAKVWPGATPMLSYVQFGYAGVTGGVRNVFTLTQPQAVSSAIVGRTTKGSVEVSSVTATLGATTGLATQAFLAACPESTTKGSALFVPYQKNYFTIESPPDTDLKFRAARSVDTLGPNVGNPYSESNYLTRIRVLLSSQAASSAKLIVHRFASAADDTYFHWFQGFPPFRFNPTLGTIT